MSLKDIDGSAITTKYIYWFLIIFVASVTKRIFVTKKTYLYEKNIIFIYHFPRELQEPW